MEENKNQNLEPQELTPVVEPIPSQAPLQMPLPPQTLLVQDPRSKGVFWKVFFASLLALLTFAIVKIFFWGAIIAALFVTEPVVVPERAILCIDLQETILDAPSRDPMSSFDVTSVSIVPQITLLDALTAIDAAKNDDRIKGIYINLKGYGASATVMEELRAAIADFKLSGKFVVAYNESYDQWGYYLASVADEVYIHPEGSFSWTGVSLSTMFYTGLIEKLGIDIDILRPTECRYKSAVEPFFLKSLSKENREQLQALADDVWGVMNAAVSASRDISVEQLNAYADNLSVVLPQEAVECEMVDGVMYADQMEQLFAERYELDYDDAVISLGTYAQTVGLKSDDGSKQLAIIYANGEVLDGNGPEDAVYGEALSLLLKEAREDESVKAVVLRVNSPGGSALASDLIWREMTLLQQQKPVVVSMGEYAASGGYYISAPADAIVANEMTLTGSIGVFGILPSFGGALEDNLGITFDGVKTNVSGDMGQGIKPLNEVERGAMMRSVDRVYERFTSLVAEGRNLSLEQVYDIAEGRVWSGKRAIDIGLVDMNGGLYTAIAYAANIAHLGTSYQIVEFVDVEPGLEALLSGLSADVKREIYNSLPMAEPVAEMMSVQQMLTSGGVYTFCPYSLEFK